jgi:hypothetical protein
MSENKISQTSSDSDKTAEIPKTKLALEEKYETLNKEEVEGYERLKKKKFQNYQFQLDGEC